MGLLEKADEMEPETKDSKMGPAHEIRADHVSSDIQAEDFDHRAWQRANPVRLTRYWSGEDAPPGRHAEGRVIWSDQALNVRFLAQQNEPFVITPNPLTIKKTMGLWERDVCEIFIAPNAAEPNRYFEFEAAPTGEWIDLAIHLTPEKKETDWDFDSGMTAAGRVHKNHVFVAMRIPWDDWIRRPQRGDKWRTNLFRCVGRGENRGYLAWQPTFTKEPYFHVPQVFQWLRFA